MDGVQFRGSEMPPALECSLAWQDTGKEIPLVPDYVETNKHSNKRGNREGVLLVSTTVDEPGNYTFSFQYPDGEAQPKIVVAFGKNLVWESVAVIIRTAGRIFGGLAVLWFGCCRNCYRRCYCYQEEKLENGKAHLVACARNGSLIAFAQRDIPAVPLAHWVELSRKETQ